MSLFKHAFIFLLPLMITQVAFSSPSVASNSQDQAIEQLRRELGLRADMSGQSRVEVENQVSQDIRNEYNYDVSCKKAVFSGLSDWGCLIGLRKFQNLLEAKQIQSNPEVMGITSVVITGRGDVAYNIDSTQNITIYIPYDAAKADIIRTVNHQLMNPKRYGQRQFLDQLEERIASFEEQTGFDVEADSDVSTESISYGMTLLEASASKFTEALKDFTTANPLIVFQFSDVNRNIYEDQFRLRVVISVNNTVEEAKAFLNKQSSFITAKDASSFDAAERKTWYQVQQLLKTLPVIEEKLKLINEQSPQLEVACDGVGVDVAYCLQGLNNIIAAFDLVGKDISNKVHEAIVTRSITGVRTYEFNNPPAMIGVRVSGATSPADIAHEIYHAVKYQGTEAESDDENSAQVNID